MLKKSKISVKARMNLKMHVYKIKVLLADLENRKLSVEELEVLSEDISNLSELLSELCVGIDIDGTKLDCMCLHSLNREILKIQDKMGDLKVC